MSENQAQALWWQTGIIYQIYPRSFMDSNEDGIGDLNGIRTKLNYLTWLGIDGLWLSPIFPSPMADFGYDISDYTGIDPTFGSLADFDKLLVEVHRRGLKLILDLVPNHTSDEHPWFKEGRSSRDNPKRDWYIWRDPAPDGGPPNNWQSRFGGSAWQFDDLTGQYYLHLYDVKQPDLDWRNPLVRQEIYKVMRFWFERGVDGFRIDVLYRLIKDEQFRDNPPNLNWQEGMPDYDRFAELYTADRPEVQEIVREMRQVAEEYPERVLIGEIYLPYPQLVRYYGRNLDGAHLPFNFELILLQKWQARAVAALVNEYEAILPEGAWPNWVLSNHDRNRLVTRIGIEQARVAQMLLLTLRGTPTCYYGDELGMGNVEIRPEQTYDPRGKFAHELSRDPVRTPMQWDSSPNAGFCAPGVTSWLPVADDYHQQNVAREKQEAASMLSLVRNLINLRKMHPVLQLGNYSEVNSGGRCEDCFSYLREWEGQRFLVVLNFSSKEQQVSIPLPGVSNGDILLSTLVDREGAVNLADLTLRGAEGLIIRL